MPRAYEGGVPCAVAYGRAWSEETPARPESSPRTPERSLQRWQACTDVYPACGTGLCTTSAPDPAGNHGESHNARQGVSPAIHPGQHPNYPQMNVVSQAQSASSILVTRSTRKPQASGPGLYCCLGRVRRRAPDPHQKAGHGPSDERLARACRGRPRPPAAALDPSAGRSARLSRRTARRGPCCP